MLAVLMAQVAYAAPPAAGAADPTGPVVHFISIIAVGDVGYPADVDPRISATEDESFTVTPSCSLLGSDGSCLPEGADPGVLVLSPTARGAGQTSCDGLVFDVTLVDTTYGTYLVTPRPGTGSVRGDCRVQLRYDALKLPVDADPAAPGLQTIQVATTSRSDGTTTSYSHGSDQVRVSRVPTIVDATASSDVALGSGTLGGTATLFLPGYPPAPSTVAFSLYGPDDADCSRAPAFTSTVVANARSVTSAGFTPHDVGTYRWVASYAGNAENVPESSACHDAPARTVVGPASPTVTAESSPTPVVGSGMTGTATLSGRVNPRDGATVTFDLFGPDQADCSGTPAFTSTVPQPVSSASVASAPFTPSAGGTYRWVASYSGDANNRSANSPCDGETASATVTTPSTTTVSLSPAPVAVRATRATVQARVRSGGVEVTGGFVDVHVDDALKGRVPVANGLARLTLPVFGTIGRRVIRVEYTGVSGVTHGSTGRADLLVEKAHPRVGLSLRPRTVRQRRTRPTLMIAVTAPGQTLTGDVLVQAPGRPAARLRLSGGQALLQLPRYRVRGPKTVRVTYQGNSTAHPSSSVVHFRVVR